MQNKVVLITGASQGLGRELSIQLAKLGAKIALIARSEKELAFVKNQINADGGTCEYFVCDLISPQEIKKCFETIIEVFGVVDILINNAGIWTNDKLEAKEIGLIEKSFSINSVAPIYLSKLVAPIFEKNNSGHFVFINSIAGLEMAANKDYGVYAATKWALTGYANALKSKYEGSNIKVTSIHPGPISTNIDKAAGENWHTEDDSWMMTVFEVAQMVIFALNAPDKIQVGTLELKNTNWNQ